MRRHHKLPFGTELTADGVRFRLWAPRARKVELLLEAPPIPALPMVAEPDGWFSLTTGKAGAGSRYRYSVDGAPYPDPASRYQPDSVHRASEVIDPAAYEWRDAGWNGRPWHELVIYELHLGAFSERGDFTGAIAHLDHLVELGVTAIELMPIAECPGRRNWGYDGVQWFAPSARYGRPEALKALIDECHARGIAVFLDAVHAILDQSAPDILTELAETVRRHITDRPVHLVLENDRNEARRLARDYAAQWNDDLHHALHVLLTGEARGYYGDYAERPIEQLGRALATGFAYQGEPSEHRHGHPRGESSAHLPATVFVSFLQNHDQIGNTPFGTRIGANAPEPLVHAAAVIVLLSPEIPLLFMGEGWASRRPFPFFCDFGPPLDGAVREGRRREFVHYPEFADPEAQRHIPDPNAEATFAAARLDWSEPREPEHASWLERYRKLLTIRHREIVPRLDGITPGGEYMLLGQTALRVTWRLGDGTRLVLLANFADAPFATPESVSDGRLLYSTGEPPGDEMPPQCAVFYLQIPR